VGVRSERIPNGPEKQRLYSFMSEVADLFQMVDYHKRDNLDKQTRDEIARLMIDDLDNNLFVLAYPCLALNTVSAMLLAD
jgi:hypothetical protein